MKRKINIIVLLSHLAVLLSLFFPVIHVEEIRLGIEGASETESYYVSFLEFAQNGSDTLTAVLMMILICVHFLGIINALYVVITNKESIILTNLTFAYSFASSLMGALQLYSRSYVLFLICAASFLIIAISSIILVRKIKA